MVMDRDGQPLGPSGGLANRIRDHVAAAKELLRQSHQVAERAGPMSASPSSGWSGPTRAPCGPATRPFRPWPTGSPRSAA
jgi:hypothetical protein